MKQGLDIDPNRWPDVSQVFAAAATLDGPSRNAYLDDACRHDPALRAAVESLLGAHDNAGSFGGAPVFAAHSSVRRLTPESQLGPFRIESWIGAGGMGEVYRAYDTKLHRAVAIKVLPDSLAKDPNRLARFEEEARALAALNHPHIGAIYGVEESAGVAALVLELVEGPTLAERLAAGPPQFGEVVRIARQLADGLEAAHERGIVHRDLKPANIKITPDGNVKILDFGLAKTAGSPPGAALTPSTTSPREATQFGTVLGTAGYMSPEQARGQAVDKRTDIWAFGCVLFEMCAHQPPFAGATIGDAQAAVIEREPDWTLLRADTPPHLVRLLRRCLTKDSKLRLRDIGEARIALEQDADTATVAPRWTTGRVAAITALLTAAASFAIALAVFSWQRSSPSVSRFSPSFTIDPPPGEAFSQGPALLAVSPDGSRIAFTTDTSQQLWVHPLDSLVAQRLDRASDAFHPFWSPDGRNLAYTAFGGGGVRPLRRIDTTGGSALTLAERVRFRSAWSPAGVILFSGEDGRLYRIPEAGGSPTLVVDLDAARQETLLAWPTFLPDGRRFVFLGRSSERAKSALFLASLDAPGRTHLVDVLSSVEYANGHLFYHRDGTLYAHPFDANAGRLTGAALPVVKDIRYNAENGRGAFSVSSTVLAYVTGTNIIGSPNRSILRFDQFGNQVGSVGAIGAFDRAALSPDGRRLVVEEQSQDAHQVGTLRLMDVDRGLPTRFTVGAVDEFHPVWTPNGSAIVFGSTRPNASGIYRRAAGGGATTDELLFASAEPAMPTGFSPDGKTLLFQRGAPSRSRIEALMVPDPQAAAPAQGAKTIVVFPGSTTPDSDAVFSPDSKWIAYTSGDDVNSSQIYVQPYPADGRRIRISETAGRAPRWTLDGKQIIYRTSQDDITSVPLTMVDGAPQPGAPKKLFNQRRQGRFLFDFSVDRRGEHFVLIVPPPATTTEEQSPIKVILNWAARVAKR